MPAQTVIGTSRKIQQTDFSSPSFSPLPGRFRGREAPSLWRIKLSRVSEASGSGTQRSRVSREPVDRGHDDAAFQRMLDMNLNSVISCSPGDDPRPAADGQRSHYRDRESQALETRKRRRRV